MRGWPWPVDVRIQYADDGAFHRQRQRQVDRRGGFADAALARGDGQHILDVLYRLEILLHRVATESPSPP